MKNLVIKTTEEQFVIADVEEKSFDIQVGERCVYFGDKAAINLNNFISYIFVEVKENE